jgi:hypothetical protein
MLSQEQPAISPGKAGWRRTGEFFDHAVSKKTNLDALLRSLMSNLRETPRVFPYFGTSHQAGDQGMTTHGFSRYATVFRFVS